MERGRKLGKLFEKWLTAVQEPTLIPLEGFRYPSWGFIVPPEGFRYFSRRFIFPLEGFRYISYGFIIPLEGISHLF